MLRCGNLRAYRNPEEIAVRGATNVTRYADLKGSWWKETERRANLPAWDRQRWGGEELNCRDWKDVDSARKVHTMLPISSCRGDFDPRINTMCTYAGLHRARARHGETSVMMGNSAVGIVPCRRCYSGYT